jgi:DNA segregation ATPase FtsK/SpoIIIE, S-DNA-T family
MRLSDAKDLSARSLGGAWSPGGAGYGPCASKLRLMANARKRSSRKAARSRRARTRGATWRARVPGLALPQLDRTQRDVLGLGLVALGVFMGFVLYGNWDGGRLGHGLGVALGWCIGRARGLAPPALVIGGVALLADQVLPIRRPLRTGGACLFAAVTLALAAGTLGLSGGTPAGKGEPGQWRSAFLQGHGGIVGQAFYWVAHRLVQTVGVDILVLFLGLAGVVLLSGASLAALLRATGGGVAETTRVLRSGAQSLERASRTLLDDWAPLTGSVAVHDHEEAVALAPQSQLDLVPPEPDDPQRLIVRATHVEAPSQDTDDFPARHSARGPGAGGRAEADADAQQGPRYVAGGVISTSAGDRLSTDVAAGRERGADEQQKGESQEGDPHEVEPRDGRGKGDERPLLTPQGRLRDVVTDDPDFVWELPVPERILERSGAEQGRPDTAGQERIAAALTEALGHFGVQAKVIGTVAGPHITRYELRLAPGTKVGKVAQLKDDLAYALAATDIRILAPIPGKQAVGVEVPNAKRRIVRLGDVFQEPPADWSPLTVWLGKDVAGKAIGADLTKMPHLLVAGTTGAGKSGAINAMLCSVLLRATPHDVRVVLVDPKQVELNHYESIPHLLTPVITSPRMAANALQNLVREMEQRYGIMSLARARSLVELNRVRERRQEAPLPYILCVIDELADLMMVAPADVEDSIIRLAQKARAVGIHLVLATQSPRVDVITGMIKANVPSRIAFAVSSQTDSRVILDQNGAESLLGQGDMLFSPVGSSRLQRIQGAYIDEAQIAKLTDMWRRQGEPELREELLEEVQPTGEDGGTADAGDPDEDPLLRDSIVLVAEMQTASTSMLQRRLRLGYTRAGRLIDMLERRGVISGYEGSKPRQVLISEADLPRVLAALDGPATSSEQPTLHEVR